MTVQQAPLITEYFDSRQDDADISSAHFGPVRIGNVIVETNQHQSNSTDIVSDFKLTVVGLSSADLGSLTISNIPGDGAQYLLERLFVSPDSELSQEDKLEVARHSAAIAAIAAPSVFNPFAPQSLREQANKALSELSSIEGCIGDGNTGKEQQIRAEAIERLLVTGNKLGGKIFSEDLGIFPPNIVEKYGKLLNTVETNEIKVELFINQHHARGWQPLTGDLVEHVRDEGSLVWIKVDTTLTTTRAHEDKLEFIIARLMAENTDLKDVLDDAWFKERGTNLDLRVIHNIPGEHVKVEKGKLLMLLGRGLVMTVVDGTPELEDALHQALKSTDTSDPAAFVLNAMKFGLEKNEEIVRTLRLKHTELHGTVWARNAIKLDLTEHAELIDGLTESARYIGDQSRDYIDKLEEMKEGIVNSKNSNLQKVHQDLIDQARNVLEMAEGLLASSEKLAERTKETREEQRRKPEVVAVIAATTSLPIVATAGVALFWQQADAVGVGLIAAGLVGSVLTYKWLRNLGRW